MIVAQRRVADLDLPHLEAVRLELARHEIAPRDLELLARRVAGKADDLHAVAQRPGNGVEHVRRGDEHHVAQVERHREIVVAERRVLLGVEHFEQRRAGIAMDAGAELVDLVEHHHAVAGARLADRLDDVAGQRADIGAAMAADFRLVMDAAEAHPHELAAHGAGDRLAERGLADAGRADEAQDRRLAVRRELAHGEIFDDPPLDLVEAEMVLVEDAPRLRDVDRGFLGQRPGQLDQPVEIGAHHAVLAGGLRHALQPAQFLARLVLDLLRHLGLGDGGAELRHLRALALVAFAELALDRGHLLAQQHLAVARIDRRLGLAADLRGEAQHLDAVGEQTRHPVHPRLDVDRLENLLLLVGGGVHVGRDHVGERRRRLDALDRGEQLGRSLRQQLHRLDRLSLEVDEARLDVVRHRGRLGDAQHAGDEERPAVQELDDLEALLALADEMVGAVGRGDVAHDVGDRAHPVHVDRQGIGGLGVALHQDADRALLAHRLLRRRDRARTADRDRQHDAGKQHGVAHGNDDERIRRAAAADAPRRPA